MFAFMSSEKFKKIIIIIIIIIMIIKQGIGSYYQWFKD